MIGIKRRLVLVLVVGVSGCAIESLEGKELGDECR